MGAMRETSARLAAANAEARRLLARIDAAVRQVDRAIDVLRVTTAGSGQPRVAEAVAKLELARRGFTDGGAALRAAVQAADEYRRRNL